MNERICHTAFLKAMLQREGTREQHLMRERLVNAERDEKCLCSALRSVGVLGMLSLCGLCYEAIFVEDFFRDPTLLITRLFGYLGLGSAICWLGFLGYWLWQRHLTNRLLAESHKLLMSHIGVSTQFPKPAEETPSLRIFVSKHDSSRMQEELPVAKAA